MFQPPLTPPTHPTGPPGMSLTRRCCECGYDLRGSDASICPECGSRVPSALRCPSCRFHVPAWVFEECPDCGRLLDCTADDDQTPPFGRMDVECSECACDLRVCEGLRCPECQRLRLLRLDFEWRDYILADEALSAHGLRIERRAVIQSLQRYGAIWIRRNCWPSADWVLEAANVKPLRADSVSRLRFCSACGYDLRGIDSTRCPECGAPVG